MSRISECYDSLEKAKEELASLECEFEKYDPLVKKYYGLDMDREKDAPISTLKVRLVSKRKNKRKRLFWTFGVCYPAIIAFWFILGIFLDFQPSVFVSVSTSLFMTTNMEGIMEFRNLKKKRKFINEALEYIGKSKGNAELSVNELMIEMTARNVELEDAIANKKQAILEYEHMLNGIREEVANEIMESHGINAEIEINSRRKPKSLIKINVNK